MKTQSTLKGLVTAAAALATIGVANASQIEPKIAVPSPAGIQGCWSADRTLYGPYQLSFCLDRFGGSYKVTGGGLNCRAELTWWRGSNGYRFAMDRATCGRGTDWTADSFTCEAKIEAAYYSRSTEDEGLEPRIAVPSPSPDPETVKLDCRYKPSVFGYPAKRFAAYRD